MKWCDWMPWSWFFERWVLSKLLTLSSFTFIKRLFSSSSLCAIRVISSAYLRLLIFLQAILISACNSSSMEFCVLCSAYKLNKQGDNEQPCHTPFSVVNQSVVSYKVLIVVSWPAYRFLSDKYEGLLFPSPKEFSTVCYEPYSQSLRNNNETRWMTEGF